MPEPLTGLMAVLAIDTPTHVAEPMHLPDHRAADGSTSVVTHQGEEGIEILVEGALGQAFNAVMGDGRD